MFENAAVVKFTCYILFVEDCSAGKRKLVAFRDSIIVCFDVYGFKQGFNDNSGYQKLQKIFQITDSPQES